MLQHGFCPGVDQHAHAASVWGVGLVAEEERLVPTAGIRVMVRGAHIAPNLWSLIAVMTGSGS